MSPRLRVARMVAAPEEWNRRRLQVALAVVALVIGAVVAGVIWTVVGLLGVGSDQTGNASDNTSTATDPRPVQEAPVLEAQPGPLSAGSAGSLRLQQPSSLGEAQVGTGFDKSPEGALGQLIAIDRRAIESASVVTAQDVITAWSAPGGPTAETWSGVAAVRTLLESAQLPASGATELTIQLEPAMGLILDDAPTVCVDFILSVAVLDSPADRIAVADCQHMEWVGERWVIAEGEEASPTASLWPGSQASYDAGYQWLEIEP